MLPRELSAISEEQLFRTAAHKLVEMCSSLRYIRWEGVGGLAAGTIPAVLGRMLLWALGALRAPCAMAPVRRRITLVSDTLQPEDVWEVSHEEGVPAALQQLEAELDRAQLSQGAALQQRRTLTTAHHRRVANGARGWVHRRATVRWSHMIWGGHRYRTRVGRRLPAPILCGAADTPQRPEGCRLCPLISAPAPQPAPPPPCSMDAYQDWSLLGSAQGMTAAATVPLCVGDQAYGVLLLAWAQSPCMTPE